METTIWILSSILYITFGIIVGFKQFGATKEWMEKSGSAELFSLFIGGFLWPITLTIYIIRAVFFEDWI